MMGAGKRRVGIWGGRRTRRRKMEFGFVREELVEQSRVWRKRDCGKARPLVAAIIGIAHEAILNLPAVVVGLVRKERGKEWRVGGRQKEEFEARTGWKSGP
jgi:hypothetical protein